MNILRRAVSLDGADLEEELALSKKIDERIKEICEEIQQKGVETEYQDVYDILFEMVESIFFEENEQDEESKEKYRD